MGFYREIYSPVVRAARVVPSLFIISSVTKVYWLSRAPWHSTVTDVQTSTPEARTPQPVSRRAGERSRLITVVRPEHQRYER